MSIICYTGLPGFGKTYSAVQNFVIPALKEGRTVVHNLILNVAALNVVCEKDVSPLLVQITDEDKLDDVIRKSPPGAAICLDEVWNYVPSGSKVTDYSIEQLTFFKKHRHRTDEKTDVTTEILIIDQDPKTGVTSWLRSLVELTYIHTKLSKLGLTSKFRVDVYTKAQSPEKPSKSMFVRSMLGSYKPEIWNCYVSHTQSSRLGESGLEKAVDQRATIWKSWKVKGAILAMCFLPIALVGVYKSMKSIASSGGRNAAVVAESGQRASTASDQTASAVVQSSIAGTGIDTTLKKTKPRESKNWRFAGIIQIGTRRVVALAGIGGRVVSIDRCREDIAKQWFCEVDGELVTAWSGPRSEGIDNFVREHIVGGPSQSK